MKRRIATVGTFDGVHRGHRAVISLLKSEGEKRGLEPLIMTFTSHPLELIAPERAPKMLMTRAEKDAALDATGVPREDLDFSRELCALTAAQWIARLRDEYGVDCLVVGYDNTFGCDGRNLPRHAFHDIGKREEVEVIDGPELPGISSSAIRRAVLGGEVENAADMLGRPYSISGTVVHGRHLGTSLGFPTANLQPDPRKAIPAPGVYAAIVSGTPDGRLHPGVINIGSRPTVERNGLIVPEVYIEGFSGDLYGHTVTVYLLERLRDEQKFPDLESLKRAISADAARAAQIAESYSKEL